MAQGSKIEWTDASWNPMVGCTIISPGCKNCYAMKFTHRFAGEGQRWEGLTVLTNHGPRWSGKVQIQEQQLLLPLKWRKPRMIFVNSMSDLFHEGIPDEYIEKVFAVMACAPQHVFQILTKRADRMLKWFSRGVLTDEGPMRWPESEARLAHGRPGRVFPEIKHLPLNNNAQFKWPLPNVWLGVSVEDQKTADERIPLLLQTPAAVRWISAEPLLRSIELGLNRWIRLDAEVRVDGPFAGTVAPAGIYRADSNPYGALSVIATNGHCLGIRPDECTRLPLLDWVVVGGESGPGARPMHPDWARSLRDQCVTANVPYFFKQWGEWGETPYVEGSRDKRYCEIRSGMGQGIELRSMRRVGKKSAGRLLDGQEWNQYPSVIA